MKALSSERAVENPELLTMVLNEFPYFEALTELMLSTVFGRLETLGNVLEIGSATGVFTKRLISEVKRGSIDNLVCLEPLERFYASSKKVNQKTIKKYPLEYKPSDQFDTIMARLTYHHVPHQQKSAFLNHMRSLLKDGGVLLLGDMFLPPYETASERPKSVEKYYAYLDQVAKGLKRDAHVKEKIVRDFEISMQDELSDSGEYKESLEATIVKLRKADFTVMDVRHIDLYKPHYLHLGNGVSDTGFYVILASKAGLTSEV